MHKSSCRISTNELNIPYSKLTVTDKIKKE